MDCNHVLYCFLFVSLPDEVYHLAEIRLLLTGSFLSGKTTIGDTMPYSAKLNTLSFLFLILETYLFNNLSQWQCHSVSQSVT